MHDGASVHTTLPALDMDRAKAFYKDKIGAELADEAPGGSFFKIGDSTFSLYPTPNPNRGGHTQMGIQVKDLESAVSDMKGRGVTFEEYDVPGLKTVNGIAELGGTGKAAWFKDTEGNTVGVLQLDR
jgi:predicted enzyme related to lactoylglutathione lyase